MTIKNNKDTSHITIEIPKKHYKTLEAHAEYLGKSVQEIIVEAIQDYLKKAHIPNKATIKAIRDVESGKGLIRAKNAEDLFKKLGI